MVVTQIIIAELKQPSTAEELSSNSNFQTYLKRALGHADSEGIVWGIVDGQPTRLIIAADWADRLPNKVKQVVEQTLSSLIASIKSHVQVRFDKSPVQLIDTSSKPILELVQVILKEDCNTSEYKEIVSTVFQGCPHSVEQALEESSSQYYTTVAAWPTIDDAKKAKLTETAAQARAEMPPMCAGFVGHFQLVAQVAQVVSN